MRKLLVLTCALMLVSGMAFAKRAPASVSPSHGPADLAAFPDAGKFWVNVDAANNGLEVKANVDNTKVKTNNFTITPSVTYAINKKFAAKVGFGIIKGTEFIYGYGQAGTKAKVEGFTNPTVGVIYRAIDCGKSKRVLNIGLNVSPNFGKKKIKPNNNNYQKTSAVAGETSVNLNFDLARPIGNNFVYGVNVGITRNGQQQIKDIANPANDVKVKPSFDYNVGIAGQYKGINKLALTVSAGYTQVGPTKIKGANNTKFKSYRQSNLGVDVNYNVANNLYIAANWNHNFKAQVKGYRNLFRNAKLAKVYGDTYGIGATYQF